MPHVCSGVANAKPRSLHSVPDTTAVTTGPVVQDPKVSYEHPVTKTIAEVKITGSTSYDDFVLSSLSGLNVGDEIQIPGNALTSAVNRLKLHSQSAHVLMLSPSQGFLRVIVKISRNVQDYVRGCRSLPMC